MTVNYTTNLALGQPVTGTESGTWGDDVNNSVTSYLDIAIAGTVTLTNDGAVTLSNTQGTSSATNIVSSLTGAGSVSAQFAIIRVTGTLTTAKVLTAPSSSKTFIVVNAATGSTVTIKASGQSGVSVAVGETATVYFNGTDYVKSATTLSGTGTVTSVGWTGGIVSVATATTTPAFTIAGTSGGIPYFSSASAWASSAALAANSLVVGGGAGAAPASVTTGTGVVTALGVNTGSVGAFVVQNGALGTPSSGTLTNCTGLPLGSVTGLGTGVATALAVAVGSAGAFVTFNGALGTPSSGTVTNLTGTASININGTVGATTANTGAFTTLSASSTVSGTGFSTYLASPPAIGTSAAAAGNFTNSQITSLGVGTAASGTTGEIRATNNITAYYSDDRLKTRLGVIENALEKVGSLDTFYYEANEVAQALGYEPVREVGLSAQQVQAVMPEVVAPAPIDEKYLTVRYERLIALAFAAIKELKAEIETLKAGV